MTLSHHQRIYLHGHSDAPVDIGYVRITNDGKILSIWIDTKVQRTLFIPDNITRKDAQ